MKLLYKFFIFLIKFVILLLIIANLFIVLSGRFYLYKGIANTYLKGRSGPSIYDKDVFYYKKIKKAYEPFHWKKSHVNKILSEEDEQFMNTLKTSSFLVIKNDSIIYEKYWNKHNKNTVSNGFSATKTLVALLIGAAIKDKYIKSIDEPIGNYLQEFKSDQKKHITIKHLLTMSSGLDWEESSKNPLSENAQSYYGQGLKKLAFNQKSIEKPNVRFNYQSGNSQLLGFIIEIATNKDLSQYASEKIWSKIGTENDAYWSLDNKNGDEKAFCCFYGTTRDFARLGKLIIQKGMWNGKEIIPISYMTKMFQNEPLMTEEGIENYRYGLHIWTYLGGKNPVYYCRGILGQYIITIPNENIIIVRTGLDRLKNIEKSENKFKIGHPKDFLHYLSIGKKIVNY